MSPDLVEVKSPEQVETSLIDKDVLEVLNSSEDKVFLLNNPESSPDTDKLIDFEIALRKGRRTGFLVG